MLLSALNKEGELTESEQGKPFAGSGKVRPL